MTEPIRQRRVEILHPALCVSGEEARRRVVEIVDRPLQFEEGVLLTLAVAGDLLDRPGHQWFAGGVDFRQCSNTDAIPEGRAVGAFLPPAETAGKPDIFACRTSVPRRPRQPIDGFADFRLPGKQARHAYRHAIAQRAGKLAVLRVDIADLAVAVGNHRAERQAVDDGLGQRPALLRRRKAEQPGGEREEAEDPNHRQQPEKHHDVVARDAVAKNDTATAAAMKNTARAATRHTPVGPRAPATSGCG